MVGCYDIIEPVTIIIRMISYGKKKENEPLCF